MFNIFIMVTVLFLLAKRASAAVWSMTMALLCGMSLLFGLNGYFGQSILWTRHSAVTF